MIDNIDSWANEVVENEQWERTRPEKICVDVAWWSICLAWESDEDDMKGESNKMKNNRNLRNILLFLLLLLLEIVQCRILISILFFLWSIHDEYFEMIYQSCFSSPFSLIFSTRWCHHIHTFDVFFCYVYCWCHCVVPWWEVDSFYLLRIRKGEREKRSLKWYLIKKKGVIHMVNMSFFLNTCSIVKAERTNERERERSIA